MQIRKSLIADFCRNRPICNNLRSDIGLSDFGSLVFVSGFALGLGFWCGLEYQTEYQIARVSTGQTPSRHGAPKPVSAHENEFCDHPDSDAQEHRNSENSTNQSAGEDDRSQRCDQLQDRWSPAASYEVVDAHHAKEQAKQDVHEPRDWS